MTDYGCYYAEGEFGLPKDQGKAFVPLGPEFRFTTDVVGHILLVIEVHTQERVEKVFYVHQVSLCFYTSKEREPTKTVQTNYTTYPNPIYFQDYLCTCIQLYKKHNQLFPRRLEEALFSG